MRRETILGTLSFVLYLVVDRYLGLASKYGSILLAYSFLMVLVGLLPRKYYNKLKSEKNQEK